MEEQPTVEELKELAAQLGRPEGARGLEVAESMNEFNRDMTTSTIELLAIAPSDVILELGPANGDHVKEIMSKAQGLEYHGLEISDTMVQEARKRNEALNNGSIHFLSYDGTNLPFPDALFNKIFTVNTIYFWEAPAQLMAGIHRVLKPGGTAVVTFSRREFMEELPFTRWGFHLYDEEEVIDLARKAGFDQVRITNRSDQFESDFGKKMERRYSMASMMK